MSSVTSSETGTGTAEQSEQPARGHRVPTVLASTGRRVKAHPYRTALVAVIVVAAVVLAVIFTAGSSSGTTTGVQTTTTLTAVATGTVKETVSTTGTFSPADEDDVSFGSSADITSVRVTVGQKVTKGQVLGTIATVTLEETLAQAQVTQAQAKATLASAEDSSDTTDAQLAADKAEVTSAASTVASAKAAVAGATLTSPISGTVAEVNVAKGDQSGGSGSSGGSGGASSSGGAGSSSGGTSASTTSTSSTSGDFVIVGGRSWTVSASVDDTEVGLIAKGDQAQITTDNVTGTVFGTVSSIAVLSSESSGSASYPVTIAVTGSPSGLHDGAAATASIVYKQATNVLTVPAGAVHTDGSSSYVNLDRNGKQTKQTVTTGLSSDGTTQISSGLTSGEQVYVTTIRRTTGTGGTGTRSGFGGFPSGSLPSGVTFPGAGTGNGGFGGGTGGGAGGFGGGR